MEETEADAEEEEEWGCFRCHSINHDGGSPTKTTLEQGDSIDDSEFSRVEQMERTHQPARPKKRLACDACHRRKLRCSKDPSGCSRCVRERLTCIYSPALKVGRPSKASEALHSNNNNRQLASPPEALISDFFHFPDDDDDVTAAAAAAAFGLSTMAAYTEPLEALGHQTATLFESLGHSASSNHNHYQDHAPGAHGESGTWRADNDNSPVGYPHASAVDPQLSSCSVGPAANPSHTIITHTTELLSRLQQDVLRYKSATYGTQRDSNASSSSPLLSSSSSPPSWRGRPVEVALKPAQETLDIIIDLLLNAHGENEQNAQSPPSFDWQTALHLVLSPASVLLSTYSEIVQDLRTVTTPLCSSSSMSIASSTSRSRPLNSIGFRIGDLQFHGPLQLILLATVLQYHLSQFGHTLETFRNKHLDSINSSIAGNLSSSTVSGLQSTIEHLLSKVRNILQRSPDN
ncbi:Zn(II)2Cys6 transcription factor domain-containing protein [Aspergillus tanneri]|uniref:Zn(2)-C6 fungal-type domain-containing protein n=1 Tax=Aspergillus tanneri TaxID=1220188 RepID=A0A5M9N4X1_9EURO|nr:uncharacterized protein ATNIH1004_001539 [Aspergillus tanneri]KAA8652634.1 hypothetical protein ATNIH1004_001539 [Aspergillus tanneri]